jgi:hypothetical protein
LIHSLGGLIEKKFVAAEMAMVACPANPYTNRYLILGGFKCYTCEVYVFLHNIQDMHLICGTYCGMGRIAAITSCNRSLESGARG